MQSLAFPIPNAVPAKNSERNKIVATTASERPK